MPRYQPANIEPKWQRYWEENKTFQTPEMPTGEKVYALDMFPYPSGSGLHVGHPEGYTATDIVCRFARMNGKTVLHPMGFDAFGLPAEEHAIKTNTPPRVNTEQNIATFRRQLKMLGFSYDWDRELATTDVEYFKWTQWIFLVLFDTWFDADQQKGRPISELPIPAEVKSQGETAVRKYQDDHRLAYQSDALVNWCPALGTVLANEEVIDGKSERGSHPVVRMPLRQWMLRITAYADRLEKDLEPLDWPEGIKKLQRDWIGRSVGAEVDFFLSPICPPQEDLKRKPEIKPAPTFGQDPNPPPHNPVFESWQKTRIQSGFPTKPTEEVLRIYTTRPDTLFGATYMVIAPEHPFVQRLTTPEQKEDVEKYVQAAASKSDRDRQEVTKTKTGVFTGSYAINPVNGKPVPIWVADYVLWGYGTGAIMAVPAHDERDFAFAKQFKLPIRRVVIGDKVSRFQEVDIDSFAGQEDHWATVVRDVDVQTIEALCKESNATIKQIKQCGNDVEVITQGDFSSGGRSETSIRLGQETGAFESEGVSIASGPYNGLTTNDFKKRITADLAQAGLGREAVNYKLRDWLFSRQRFWGEPFPILHELDDKGQPTGLIRAVDPKDLPVDLPHLDDYKPHGRPEPPLAKAPKEWLEPVIDGKRYRRETNTMPQWAGSCWYFLRFIDPRNQTRFVDAAKEKAWMPIDLYVGGAEHAVLHLLYSRFWHKVLFDRGHVSTVEPFRKLVNQGTILGEVEYFVSIRLDQNGNSTGEFISEDEVDRETAEAEDERRKRREPMLEVLHPEKNTIMGEYELQKISKNDPIEIREKKSYWKHGGKEYEVTSRAEKMSKSRGNVINPDDVVRENGADALRLFEMFMGPLEATKPWSTAGVVGVRGFLDRAWRLIVDDRAEELKLNESVQNVAPTEEANRVLHKTIKQVTNDIQRLEFNTAIARMMEFTNYFTKQSIRPREILEKFILILSPFAPHIAEELWQLLGHEKTLAYEPWPPYDEALTQDSQIEIPVQINGKLRGKVLVPAGTDTASLIIAAREDSRIAELLKDKVVVKTIPVAGKLVNFVVK